MTKFRFAARDRLKRPADFRRVYERRCSASDGVLIVYGCENEFPLCRLGVSVGRKVGGAVRRNRWKRLLREVFRLNRPHFPAGIDWVVIPRRTEPVSLDKLSDSMRTLASRVVHRLRRGSGS